MVEHIATVPGLFPLPDWAKEELTDLKGHQKADMVSGGETEEIEAVYDRARAEILSTQRAAGVDLLVEGQYRWDDMLTHVLSVNENVETAGIVRYYDNNNFYREPVVVDDLEPSGDVAAELEAAAAFADGTLQAVLPGPYSLAKLATDDHYGDDAEFLAALGELLAGEANAFPDVEALILLEPSLGVTNPDDPTRVREALETVADAVDAPVVVHTYWGTLEADLYATVLDADVDAVGFDLVTAEESARSLVSEHGTPDSVALGVVDGQNTRVESAEEIRATVDGFVEAAGDLETVCVTANTGLFYLPTNRFEAKLEALGRATEPEVASV
ncbi:5-methyltetrahydropteroyltriglutamate--homocysteine methyltransferase [Natrialba sp. INN-245]|uniref:5-methyltetrahydropteroyltriglutamate-- homocysteine methyltransferase n=1 Tax=Natrialba sp. INN-245 TaxID=2690967 RepID=UPI001310D920|nr:5-methyltetrahydropteroyltriglutamate--homocysteine methyltransferase [Natrialba sp. INN-245]MWV40654.1 5-methyltetrahydropteroyltriglutamate--homocysteine methyltransferase [Natrialba sp. INN-245]